MEMFSLHFSPGTCGDVFPPFGTKALLQILEAPASEESIFFFFFFFCQLGCLWVPYGFGPYSRTQYKVHACNFIMWCTMVIKAAKHYTADKDIWNPP